jgi:hypothetical protein
VDFKAIMRPVQYGKPPGSVEDVPRPIVRRQSTNRRLGMLREAGQVLTVMPGPGESLHAIQSGRYDLADLVDVMLGRLDTVLSLRIATLSFNRRNVQRMAAWTESGAVKRLTLLCSNFFREHNAELFQEVRETLSPPHRVAASRNHCKVICFHVATGDKLALEGSANLRNNGNRENFCLMHDAGLHDWHARWIDEEVTKNEGDKSLSPAAG